MYAFTWKSGHIVWKEQWYALTSGASLRTNLYVTHEDQIFVTNVVVTDLTWEIVALNVISRLVGAIIKHNAIAKIRKYKGLHEGHHFILMAMEVHPAPRCDIDYFIGECAHLFHDRWSRGHLSLSFCIQFFKQCVSIALHNVLALTIKRKIALACDAYFKLPIIIISHDLHASDIRGVIDEIAFYHEKD